MPDVASTGGGSTCTLPNDHFALLYASKAPGVRSLGKLGLLPVKDPHAPRTANLILPARHPFWQATTPEEVAQYLQESFPQLDVPRLFSQQVLQQAAASPGGSFPKPQYMARFTAVLQPAMAGPEKDAGSLEPEQAGGGQGASAGPGAPDQARARVRRACGVALVGDAIHAFPPDLGQGVNSALQDVMELLQVRPCSHTAIQVAGWQENMRGHTPVQRPHVWTCGHG